MNTLIRAAECLSRMLWALSWQIGVLVLLVWVASLIFRKAAPNFRYWLWCIVLLRLCIPATLALPWGVSGEVRHAVEVSAPQVLLAAQQTVPLSWSSPSEAVDSASSPVHEPLGPAPMPGVMRDELPHLSLSAKLGLGWMCVSLSLLIVVVMRSLRARRMLRCLPEITRPELLQLVNSLRSKCAIRRAVRVRMFSAGQTAYGPAVVGVMRPTILLPAHVAEQWSLDEIEPVLLHEFAHIKRWDLLFNWVQMLIQAVYFFHPLVWFANSRIRQERELVCDDLAVLLFRGQSKRYSRSFVRVIEDASQDFAAFQLAGVGMTEHRKPLARRIVRMMGKDYRLYRPLGWFSMALLLFVSAAAIAMAAERAVPDNAGAGSKPPESTVQPQHEVEQPTGNASFNGRVVESKWWGDPASPGGTAILVRPNAVDTIEAEVADDGSFEFNDIPEGTYFLTVKPEGRKVIDSPHGGWRLIDLAAEERNPHVILRLHRSNDTAADGTDLFLDVAQLGTGTRWSDFSSRYRFWKVPLLGAGSSLTWSHLPADLRRQAEDGFASQRDNWLGIRRVSATYRWTTRRMERGEWVQEAPRTGTMACEMVPLTQEEARKLGHYSQLQLHWRVYDNELKWNAAADDIVSGPRRIVYWQEGHGSEKSNTRPKQGMLPFHLFNQVPSIMVTSYKDEHWAGSDLTRDQYFNNVTPAIRLSTDEETETLLGGEKSYMFFVYLAQPRIWISATTGKVHQLDMWNPGQTGMDTRRYEKYIEDPVGKLSFPSRIIYTMMEGEGSDRKVREETIDLSDVRINPDLPPETFQAK